VAEAADLVEVAVHRHQVAEVTAEQTLPAALHLHRLVVDQGEEHQNAAQDEATKPKPKLTN
jgi:DNA-binding transcriptional regulator LsrR (DeoR family)